MSAEMRLLLVLALIAVAIASLAVFAVRVAVGLVAAADGSAVLALVAILAAGFTATSARWSR